MQSGALSQGSTPTAFSAPAHQSAAAKAWGTLLSAFALVARHDPRPRVADTAGAALLVSWPFHLHAASKMSISAPCPRRSVSWFLLVVCMGDEFKTSRPTCSATILTQQSASNIHEARTLLPGSVIVRLELSRC